MNIIMILSSIKYDSVKIVELIIRIGVNLKKDDYSAFRFAMMNNTLRTAQIVKLLIENGSDIHIKEDWYLNIAASNGNFELFQVLIDNGAHIYLNNTEILIASAKGDSIAIIKLAISYYCRINCVELLRLPIKEMLVGATKYGKDVAVKYLLSLNIHHKCDLDKCINLVTKDNKILKDILLAKK